MASFSDEMRSQPLPLSPPGELSGEQESLVLGIESNFQGEVTCLGRIGFEFNRLYFAVIEPRSGVVHDVAQAGHRFL